MNSNEAFYVDVHGEQKGPYSIRHLDHLLNSGLIPMETLYWTEGLEQWLPVTDLVPMRQRPRVWRRAAISLGILAVLAVLAAFFGPSTVDRWREMTQRDFTPEGAYWSARNAVRTQAVPKGQVVSFAPATEARVELGAANTADVVVRGEVLGPGATITPVAWKVQLNFNNMRREWTNGQLQAVAE